MMDMILKKRITYILLLFILLQHTLIAASTCSFSIDKSDLESVGGISVPLIMVLGISLYSFIFMIGNAFKMPKLVLTAKDELFQIILSAIFLVSFLSAMATTCLLVSTVVDEASASMGLSSTLSDNPVDSALSILDAKINQLTDITSLYVDFSINSEIRSGVSIGLFNPIQGGQFIPVGAHMSAYRAEYSLITFTFVLPAMVSVLFQRSVLLFIRDVGIYLIPLGILFRLLRPIRRTGNLFLAGAICVMIIYPLLYSFMLVGVDTVGNNFPNELNTDDGAYGNNSSYGFWAVAELVVMSSVVPAFALTVVISIMNSLSKYLSLLGV